MDYNNPPDRYWHCLLQVKDSKAFSVVNDLSFSELETQIIKPWHAEQAFTVSGKIVRKSSEVAEIKIVWTEQPYKYFADQHNAAMRASNIADMATDRRKLVFKKGEDATFELLFSGKATAAPEPDVALIEQLCRRLPQSARILANRSRKGKAPYEIEDEYDVQDLLHGMLRGYLKYSVQEDPLPKVAGAKSSRADISVEELGVLIEIKYVRSPDDQKRLFDEYSQDLVLYASWPHLRTLIYLIYNSADLRDAEAFEKLAGSHEVSGRRFVTKIVLA